MALAGDPVDAFETEILTGVVKDAAGTAVAGADVEVLTASQTSVASAKTDAQGKFSISSLTPGSYVLVVRKTSLPEARVAVTITAGKETTADVTLDVVTMRDDVTVTASRDVAEIAGRTGQPVNVITAAEIVDRVKTGAAQAVEHEVGVALQRTSSTMAGVFVRGLTGNKVNVFVDGVRYSNGAQRGGVNTFLNLIEPSSLESIEILRGPSSDQYGSDALGGSVQFLSKAPALSSPMRGSLNVSGGTAHRNAGGSLFISGGGPKVAVAASVSGRGVGQLRPGGGIDSHAAVTRFFGITSDRLMGERLPNTGFSQWGGQMRATFAPGQNTRFVTSYTHTKQDGGDRYDQLLGGDGNLIAELNDMELDIFTARMEQIGAGPFQFLSLTYGLNSQREERVNQGGQGSATASIGHEPERTTAHSIALNALRQASARFSFSLGADMQFERISSGDAFNFNPVTLVETARRPRVPDGAKFNQGGVFATGTYEASPGKFRLVGAVRYGHASYVARALDAKIVGGVPLWPDDSISFNGLGYRAAAVLTPNDHWTISGLVSRGFRAPHMTDLGTLGLTGSGFEVAAADLRAANLNGMIGTTADSSAVSKGEAVADLGPETSLNFEGTLAFRNSRFRSELTMFVNKIRDYIQKVALILPAGAVGKSLGGTPITSQNANGAVFVAATTVPVLVRANFDNARIWGIEHSMTATIGSGLMARTTFTYLRAEDTDTKLPPNIEGGTPAPTFFGMLRWTHSSGRFYLEPYVDAAWEQTHLSSLDLGDRRTGASRSTSSIRNFFNNGARNRGWIGNGADGIANTPDDILIVTGETLAQVTTRVLGTASSSSLFTSIPGYVAVGVRTGVTWGKHELVVDFENIGDKNYRGLSWGMDAPGRGVSIRYGLKF
jgi:outer membrane receptor protein involved in Fe transport